MDRISLANKAHVAIIAIVVNNIGCNPMTASYLDAMLVDDLGADPWIEPNEIANDIEIRFGITLDDNCPLRDPAAAGMLRMRDLMTMVGA